MRIADRSRRVWRDDLGLGWRRRVDERGKGARDHGCSGNRLEGSNLGVAGFSGSYSRAFPMMRSTSARHEICMTQRSTFDFVKRDHLSGSNVGAGWGPRPSQVGCAAPKQLLDEYGIRPSGLA